MYHKDYSDGPDSKLGIDDLYKKYLAEEQANRKYITKKDESKSSEVSIDDLYKKYLAEEQANRKYVNKKDKSKSSEFGVVVDISKKYQTEEQAKGDKITKKNEPKSSEVTIDDLYKQYLAEEQAKRGKINKKNESESSEVILPKNKNPYMEKDNVMDEKEEIKFHELAEKYLVAKERYSKWFRLYLLMIQQPTYVQMSKLFYDPSKRGYNRGWTPIDPSIADDVDNRDSLLLLLATSKVRLSDFEFEVIRTAIADEILGFKDNTVYTDAQKLQRQISRNQPLVMAGIELAKEWLKKLSPRSREDIVLSTTFKTTFIDAINASTKTILNNNYSASSKFTSKFDVRPEKIRDLFVNLYALDSTFFTDDQRKPVDRDGVTLVDGCHLLLNEWVTPDAAKCVLLPRLDQDFRSNIPNFFRQHKDLHSYEVFESADISVMNVLYAGNSTIAYAAFRWSCSNSKKFDWEEFQDWRVCDINEKSKQKICKLLSNFLFYKDYLYPSEIPNVIGDMLYKINEFAPYASDTTAIFSSLIWNVIKNAAKVEERGFYKVVFLREKIWICKYKLSELDI